MLSPHSQKYLQSLKKSIERTRFGPFENEKSIAEERGERGYLVTDKIISPGQTIAYVTEA